MKELISNPVEMRVERTYPLSEYSQRTIANYLNTQSKCYPGNGREAKSVKSSSETELIFVKLKETPAAISIALDRISRVHVFSY